MYGDAGSTNVHVVGCTFQNLAGSSASLGNLAVVSGNTCTNITMTGLVFSPDGEGDSTLVENNVLDGATRSFWNARFMVFRYNLIKNVVGDGFGFHADSIGPIDQGPDDDIQYGWIYGNTIDNGIVLIAITGH